MFDLPPELIRKISWLRRLDEINDHYKRIIPTGDAGCGYAWTQTLHYHSWRVTPARPGIYGEWIHTFHQFGYDRWGRDVEISFTTEEILIWGGE